MKTENLSEWEIEESKDRKAIEKLYAEMNALEKLIEYLVYVWVSVAVVTIIIAYTI